MKKLILTSATILFIGLSAFAEDGGKCTKKCEKKCDYKECTKDGNGLKKCGNTVCTPDMKCGEEKSKSCAKSCKMDESKKENNNDSGK